MDTAGNLVGTLVVTALLTTPADARSQRPLHFLSKQCNEDAVEVLLDPRPIQEFVGSEFPLEPVVGKARVAIVAQDCSQYRMDGADVGPTQEVHVWVAIRGPEDVRPVVGAERAMPTRTWFSLFTGSTDPRVREAKTAPGTAQAPTEDVVLDAPGPRRRGRVSLGKDLVHSWSVSEAMPSSRLIGLNLDVHVREPSGNVVLNGTRALMHLSTGPTKATLTVVGGTDPPPSIGPGAYPVSETSFFPMWS